MAIVTAPTSVIGVIREAIRSVAGS